VLIAGCGGGFDLYCGVPFINGLLAAGKRVVLAGVSFTVLARSGAEHIEGALWRVDRKSDELPYFPEKWLSEWLARRDIDIPIYAMQSCGGKPMRDAFRRLCVDHTIDLIVLADGGTDSLLFGDEPGLGTVAEDAVSIVAAEAAMPGKVVLAAIGFGIDHHHGISHHAFLENVAILIRDGGCLGRVGLCPGTPEASSFLDLVDYANGRQPAHPSIVCNSIASALRGEFGNFHATSRTHGSQLFISPLMLDYWAFEAAPLVRRMFYAGRVLTSETIADVNTVIEKSRESTKIRTRAALPL
jgi:hypothetical protein